MGYSHIKCCGNLGSYAEGGEYVDQPACTVCEDTCFHMDMGYSHNIDKTTIAAATDEVEQCALDCSMCDLSECGIEDDACMISDDGQSCESVEVDEPGQYPEEMHSHEM